MTHSTSIRQPTEAIATYIEKAFRPDPIRREFNGVWYTVERVSEGWKWRNDFGVMQEDMGIEPFGEAVEAQASAMRHAGVAYPLDGIINQ